MRQARAVSAAHLSGAARGLLPLVIAAALVVAAACGGGDENGEQPAPTDASTPAAAATAEPAQSLPPPPSPTRNHGIDSGSITFGQSAAFSGPEQELGRNLRVGILSAFHEANTTGLVHGRSLFLTSLDDVYEPEIAISAVRTLIEDEDVFALIGSVGAPTSRAALPLAAEAGAPYIAPFTGAEFLRDEEWRNVFNLRASYYQETEEMVARLTEDLAVSRIAIMYQDDSFGRSGYLGARRALERRNLEPVALGVYPRNTTAIKTALVDISRGNPEAVIMIGATQPVATMVKWARRIDLSAIFMTVSFVGIDELAGQLGEDGEGVYVTQVVPFPTDDSLPIVSSYLLALKAFAPNDAPGYVSFEGYLAGRLAIEGLKECGRDVDRQCFLESVRGADRIDIEGFELSFGDDNQGSDVVFLTVMDGNGGYSAATSVVEARP